MQPVSRHNSWFLVFFLFTIILFLANLWFGSVLISWDRVLHVLFHSNSNDRLAEVIVNQYRLPQTITALSTGILLSLSGLILQTLFRNPLAGPSVLGISSGASLGVALVVLAGSAFGGWFSMTSLVGNLSMIFAAFAGALLVLLVIIFVSARIGNILTVLIIGIMLGYAVSAVVGVLQFFSGAEELHAYVVWGLGSFSKTTSFQSAILLIIALSGFIMTMLYVKPLNALLLGNNYAQSIGFHTKRINTILILSTGLLVSSGTAFTGPIAFLGLAVPHLARGFFKTSQHGILVPATVLMGASLALLCNLLARLPGTDISLPINAVTSLVGAPVIIWVIIKGRHFKTM
ncbi:MAG: iron ABC transporter permease [Bacteroidales bacterium]|nr:iron ABC transporter permease [Bacteroidales bacterium]